MIDHLRYQTLKPAKVSYALVLLMCTSLALLGAYSASTMEQAGHIITGMDNHTVWGLPHVFAVALIVTASGALNGATLASVFDFSHYKPIARFTVVFAISLLVGGLVVLILDLGRPDRLIIAMTHYNFRSIFSWNIILYTGFILVCVCYLSVMMEKRFHHHITVVGRIAFVWRLVLTTGTGCIFGFLVGRNMFDSFLLIPLFIALSLVMGLCALAMIMAMLERWNATLLSDELLHSMCTLLMLFSLTLLCLSIVHYMLNLYVPSYSQNQQPALSGIYSSMFWIGYVLAGVAMPLFVLIKRPFATATQRLIISSIFAFIGCLVLLYVVIVGAQSTPKVLFPGKTIIISRFGDASIPVYSPTLWEWGLSAGGSAVAVLLCLVILRVLPLLPEPQK